MLQHVNNCLIIDNFIDHDEMIQRYDRDDIEMLRLVLIHATTNFNEDQTINLVAFCGGEFCRIKPFKTSLALLEQRILSLNY